MTEQFDIHSGSASTKGVRVVPARYSWDDSWELIADLPIEVSASRKETLATICLTAQEYGAGDSLEAAIQDLLTSLSDYYESLEAREDRLEPSAGEDLKILRKLIRPKPAA